MKKLLIMKKIIIILIISGIIYSGYVFILKKDPLELSNKIITKSDVKINDIMNVGVMNPTVVGSGNILDNTYLGEVLSEKNGSVFAYRNGIIENFLVDVGAYVKKGQVVAKMLPSEFNPDLANMIVEKKTMKIKALAMVESAQLTLKGAQERREKISETNNIMITSSKSSLESAQNIKSRVGESTQNQLDSTIQEQEAKITKMQASLDQVNTQIKIQEQKIGNMSTKTNAGVNLEASKLEISAGNIKTSIKNAYNTIIKVFYGSVYNLSNNAQSFNGNIYFGAKDTNTRTVFSSNVLSIYPRINKIDTLTQDEIFNLAKDTLTTVDLGLKVLDNTITTSDYDETMLNSDKTMLIMAKTDSMNGIQTNLNMFNEQFSMLEKEKNMAGADVSDEKLMLEELLSEKNVMEKDLEMAKTEKERMISETKNMKTMAENEALKMESETQKMLAGDIASNQMSLLEADKMVTESQKMLIDAKADLESANFGLNLLESAGFSNEIKAQFSGKITKRFINIGDSIEMSSPVFDIVQDEKEKTSNMFVRFEIPESEFSNISLEQEVSFFKTVEPFKKYSATIKRISPAINKTSKGVIVEAIIAGDFDTQILIGSSVRISIKNENVVYTIPLKVVKQDESGKTYVLKVLKNKIEKQIIKTGRVYADNIFVSEGLKIGTKIVVDDGGMVLEVGLPVTYTFINTLKLDSSPENGLIDEHAAAGHGSHKK